MPRLAPHYLLEVRRERRLDQLKVIVEAKAGRRRRGRARGRRRRDLARHVKSRIGVTSEVVVLAPGEVERSLGKAKRIVDLRPRD